MKLHYCLYLICLSFLLHSCENKNGSTVTKLLNASEIYSETVENTVTIITEKALGSGFFVAPDLIVTNYHVIEGASVVKVKLNNQEKEYTAEGYVAVDKNNDIVLIKVNCSHAEFIKIADSIPKPGDLLYAIGSPLGLSTSISDGLLSGIRMGKNKNLYQISIPISHGSSGCPILNNKGQAVGVAVGGVAEANAINFAIPIAYVKFLSDLSASQTISQAFSGLVDKIDTIIPELAQNIDPKESINSARLHPTKKNVPVDISDDPYVLEKIKNVKDFIRGRYYHERGMEKVNLIDGYQLEDIDYNTPSNYIRYDLPIDFNYQALKLNVKNNLKGIGFRECDTCWGTNIVINFDLIKTEINGSRELVNAHAFIDYSGTKIEISINRGYIY